MKRPEYSAYKFLANEIQRGAGITERREHQRASQAILQVEGKHKVPAGDE